MGSDLRPCRFCDSDAPTIAAATDDCTLAAVCHQGILNLRGDLFDAATAEPPGYHVHYWDGSRLITHMVAVAAEPRQ